MKRTVGKAHVAIVVLSVLLAGCLVVIGYHGMVFLSDGLDRKDAATAGVTLDSAVKKFDAALLYGLDDHPTAYVQIYQNGSLPAYTGNTTGSQGPAGDKNTLQFVDENLDLSNSFNYYANPLNSNYITRYDEIAYRVTNTGNANIQVIAYEYVHSVDDYIWNGSEWRDDWYDDYKGGIWNVEPGAHVEFTLKPNKTQQIGNWAVYGTYLKLWNNGPPPAPPKGAQHVTVVDGSITTEFDINAGALNFQYDESSVTMSLPLLGGYDPTSGNLMNAMAANGYSPPTFMQAQNEPEDWPTFCIFDYFPQQGSFEVTVKNN